MKKIWLVRHAQSTTNAGGIAQIPSLIEITELGRNQSLAISHEVARQIEATGREPTRIFVSTFLRTQQTALPTQQQCAQVSTVVFGNHELTYLGVASVLGTSKEQRSERVAQYWQSCDPMAAASADSESFCSFMARVQDCTASIARAPDNNWDIWFGHGQYWVAFILNEISPFDRTPDWMRWFRKIETRNPIPNAQIIQLKMLTDAELIDKDRMKVYCGDDSSVIDRLLGMFHKSAYKYAIDLEAACVGDNLPEIRELIHRLKSTVMIVGGECFRSLLCEAEQISEQHVATERDLDWQVLSAVASVIHALRKVHLQPQAAIDPAH